MAYITDIQLELVEAVRANKIKSITQLNQEGVDVNFSINGETPLTIAIKSKHQHTISSIINCGANVDIIDNINPLFEAIKSNNTDIVNYLFKKATPKALSFIDQEGNNILHHMAVSLFLSHYILDNIFTQASTLQLNFWLLNNKNKAPLTLAIDFDNKNFAQFMVSADKNINNIIYSKKYHKITTNYYPMAYLIEDTLTTIIASEDTIFANRPELIDYDMFNLILSASNPTQGTISKTTQGHIKNSSLLDILGDFISHEEILKFPELVSIAEKYIINNEIGKNGGKTKTKKI